MALQQTIISLFEAQQKNQFAIGNTTLASRKKKLKQLQKAVEVTFRQEILDALAKDLGKSTAEANLTEIYPVVSEIKHSLQHLSAWMSKQYVSTPLSLLGSSSYIQYEPKGVCLLISPWNFPFMLTFSPLISAIAAGNTVIIKPSEHSPHTSTVMERIIQSLFPPEEIALIQGAVETSQLLLQQPFNHIFFTGAPAIGKKVMAAAAQHLASVTLELGGKSPTIVDETANIKTAAKRIMWGKFMNTGQVCLAPDHIYIHHSKLETFLQAAKETLVTYYSNNPEESIDYPRIINERHYNRLLNLLNTALDQGARLVTGGEHNKGKNHIAPTLLTDVPMNSQIMEEEIFGPLLPIHTYNNLEEVVSTIQQQPKPLALYIFSTNKKNIKYITQNTRAGGTCINHNNLHISNTNLPFGGSNNSGIGKSHGFFGFQEFSNARSFYKQHILSATDFLVPPYNKWKQKIINWTIKWL